MLKKLFKKLLPIGVGLYILANSQTADARVSYNQLPVPKAGYENLVRYNYLPDIELTSFKEHELIARIQRTDRWLNIIKTVSKKHNLPEDILYGLVIVESKGEPLLPNYTKDGGFGLVHFQPTTAKYYGLMVFAASSNKIIDRSHARKLEDMIRYCDNDLRKVQMFDERAHPIKNLDAAARYLMNNYQKTRSWEKAVQSINPNEKGYAKKVFRYIENSKRNRRLAIKSFNEKNSGRFWGKTSVDYYLYLTIQWNLNNNYGLGEYINNHNPYKEEKGDYVAGK